METEVERFVRNLQTQILEETRLAYGEVALERWQNPLYNGSMDNPDGYACITGRCHDRRPEFRRHTPGQKLPADG